MKRWFMFFGGKNKKKALVLGVMFFAILVTSGIFVGKMLFGENKKEKVDISVILEKAEYSYLPVEAKNYIQVVYEETGQVLLTEKNKEEGQPYLNPKYVEYLTLSVEEKSQEALIPDELIVDYVSKEYTSTTSGDEIPTKFDLRDVDHVTPLKNQGGLGTCWSFATYAQAESYLLAQNKVSDLNSAKIFSERQLDYALSSNGLIDYLSEYSYTRELGGGGNFTNATVAMASGLALVDVNNWKAYDDSDLSQMEVYEVLNYNKSLYEVDQTVEMPILNISELDLTVEEDVIKKDNYLNTIKKYVMEYGGAYVGTGSPGYGCSVYDSVNNTYLIRDDGSCYLGSHAMQIIGWDDDYEYSYCDTTGNHKALSSSGTCTSGEVVSGKGVWLLKNSWGSIDRYSYVYLAYDSLDSVISLITEMNASSEKNWDNVYFDSDKINSGSWSIGLTNYSFTNGSDISERISEVKFFSYMQDASFDLYIKTDSDYELIDTLNVSLPGLNTFDLSNYNIVVEPGQTITVKVAPSDYWALLYPIFIYTENVSDEKVITTIDFVYSNTVDTDSLDYYEFRLLSNTRNIASMEEIEYKLFDEKGNDVTSYLSYTNNYVAHNIVNTLFVVDVNIPLGGYTLQSLYNDVVVGSSLLSIPVRPSLIDGSGTYEDPYIITNVEELKMINSDLSAHYKLGNDIVFEDGYEWVPLATYDTPFMGTFDGAGYSIVGLTITEDNEYNSLFAALGTDYEDDTVVKDVNLVDFNISVTNRAAPLVGDIMDCYDRKYCDTENSVIIENIAVIGGKIESSTTASGLIYGARISHDDGIKINNIFVSAEVIGKNYINGLISYISPRYSSMEYVPEITNVQNIGTVVSTSASPNYYSSIIGDSYGNVKLNNFLVTGDYDDLVTTKYGAAFGRITKNDNLVFNGNVSNGYYVNGDSLYYSVTFDDFFATNVSKKSIVQLTDGNLYSDWEEFDSNWVLESVDGISRIPVLKFVDFEYTSISNIELKLGETVNIYDLVTPNIDLAKNITYEIKDVSIASIDSDGNIIGLAEGNTTIHVVSGYDGYEKDVPIVVDSIDYSVVFDANGGEGIMESQIHSCNISKKLNKNKFTKLGYEFRGWNSQADGGGESYSDEQEVSNLADVEGAVVTLYAQWSPINYSINFDANGGEGEMSSLDFIYDQAQNLSDNLYTKEGYLFKEWNTKKDGTGESYSNLKLVSNLTTVDEEKVILYAQWSPINYVVNFDANGGEGKMSSQEFSYDEVEALIENTFIREGYKFTGWNSQADGGGESYSDEQEVSNLADVEGVVVTLYAQWSPNKYTVKFDNNNGQGEMNTQEFTYDVAGTLTSNSFTKVGHMFSGWNTNSDGTGTSYADGIEVINLVSEGEIILYAQWSPISYTVKYDANGGEGEMSSQEFTYGVIGNLSSNTFTKVGYKFAGWNSKSDGTGISYVDGAEIDSLVSLSEEVVLYAQWIPIEYTVSFDANGGEGEMTSQKYAFDTKQALSSNLFTMVGYKFKEWNTYPDGSGISYDDKQEIENLTETEDNIILYAQWSPVKYTIRLDKNGGEGSEKVLELIYDKSDLIPDVAYTKEGYNFSGWNTSSDGTGTSYVSGQEISNLSAIEQELVLYAQWSPITYFVSFDANGGQGEMSLQQFTYDQANNLNSNSFVREGYKFNNWNSEADGSGTSYSDQEAVTSLFNVEGGVVTLYAQWSPIKYTISFDSNGGIGEMIAQEVVYDKSTKLNANLFEKEGYEFIGWNSQIDGNGYSYTDKEEVINLTSNEENVILYAQWNPISYTVSFDANGGEGEMTSQEFIYDVEDAISFNNYSKVGYKFVGWNSKADGTGESYTDGQVVSKLTSLSEEIILYAQWSPIKYTVSFDANGGEGEMTSQEFSYDLSGKLNINAYNKIGYVFKEWNSMSDGSGVSYQDKQEVINLTDEEEFVTLYAQWSPIEYVVSFNANGGEGILDNQSFVYNTSSNLSKNVFTREGYKFAGWNTKDDGTGESYTDEAEVLNLTVVNEEVITLYAQWNPISYSVRFDSNGGEGEMDIVSFIYDEAKQLPENAFTKEGYEIKEWNTKSDGTGTSYKDKASVKNLTQNEETITLYVIWKVEVTYEINNYEFDSNNYLTKIDPNTKLVDYLENIIVGSKYSIEVYGLDGEILENDDLVTTGSTTVILLGEEVALEFINLIRGDMNGDGKVTAVDVSKLYSFVRGSLKITEDYYLKAGDANCDSKNTAVDVSKIYSYVRGNLETLY